MELCLKVWEIRFIAWYSTYFNMFNTGMVPISVSVTGTMAECLVTVSLSSHNPVSVGLYQKPTKHYLLFNNTMDVLYQHNSDLSQPFVYETPPCSWVQYKLT